MIGEAALKAISQVDPENRRRAEAAALEEVAGYLRPTYDTQVELNKEGADRNEYLVMVVCDIALYHLSASLPNRLGGEIRKERYERAIKWLEDVQKGRIVPLLPRSDDNTDNGTTDNGLEQSVRTGRFAYGGGKKQNNTW